MKRRDDFLADQWRNARTIRDRRAVVEMALSLGTVDAAARAIGLSRRHLTRIRKALEEPDRRNASSPVETLCLVGTSIATTRIGKSETPSSSRLLTPVKGVPKLMGTDAFSSVADVVAQEDIIKVTLELPREDKEWLEDEAMKEKRRGRYSRASMSRVVHRLIAEERGRRAHGTGDGRDGEP